MYVCVCVCVCACVRACLKSSQLFQQLNPFRFFKSDIYFSLYEHFSKSIARLIVLFYHGVSRKTNIIDLARTRTWNILLRRQTRYPLRHKAAYNLKSRIKISRHTHTYLCMYICMFACIYACMCG